MPQAIGVVASGGRTLIHAAAGGVGLIVCQWAHRDLEARKTVGSTILEP